ncbi:hypothetical protein U1Q18_013959 [Sarracenia purpurea var. burkii]
MVSGRNMPARTQHRRGLSLTGMSKDADEKLDLFSRTRRSLSVASSDESDVSVKSGRLLVGSAKLARSGMNDLLSSTDGAKHDYDWLLTPPGTPLYPSLDGSESQPPSAVPRSSSLVRSASTTKASRLSVSQSESNHPLRSVRSKSVTRPSISSGQYSTHANKSTSILNTSSASVSSYIRPSTPTTRSSLLSSTARPVTQSARPVTSRSSTPSKVRPAPTSSSIDRTRPSQTSRPSTPSSRPQIPANSNAPATRSASRPSTPTRQTSASLSPATGRSTSVGRVPSSGRNTAPISRPSSPGPRGRPPPQPMRLPDFSFEKPPNLRTTLPDRPLSAGRSRPGVAVAVKGNTETPTLGNATRRQPSPVVSRGRLTEATTKGHSHANGQAVHTMESRKASHVSELSMRKPIKTSATSTESLGIGRTISKKSLDMAIRHMDIKNCTGGIRPLCGTTLFPQSIRSAIRKSQNGAALSAPASVNGNLPISNNGIISENGDYFNRPPENGMKEENCRLSSKFTEVDIYEIPRYDAMLLKEDLKNSNWLHSGDGKFDQGSIFGNGFEPLPEPFDPL